MAERKLENMRIWQDTRLFVNQIYRMMEHTKDYGFRDQIQRAAISIMNNIAEGSESGSDEMYVRYLNIAKGSCSEVKSMLYLCEDFGICSKEHREKLHADLLSITNGIYKLITYLKGQPQTSKH